MDKYAQNNLLDNSADELRLATCLKYLIAMPECKKIRIATGYWDLPGTRLVYDELKEFLEVRHGELEILIGEDPHLYKSQLSEMPKGEHFPDFYIKQDFAKLTDEFQPVAQLLLNHVNFEGDSDEDSQVKIHVYGHTEDDRQFLHAKCYILTGAAGFARGIVGSSNFTAKGLGGTTEDEDGGNSELNYLETNYLQIVESANNSSPIRSHADWFEEKWANSRPWNGHFIALIKASSIGPTLVVPPPSSGSTGAMPEVAPLSPYEVYIKLLQHRFGSVVDAQATSEIGTYLPHDFLKLDYQIDAVKQCFAALHNRGGFMLADVVGLGKTIVGALVIRRFLDCPEDRPAKVLVITPPAVKTAWEETLRQFDAFTDSVKFVTVGKLDGLVETVGETSEEVADDEADDTGAFAENLKYEDFGLILIDESHKFRNATTQMYKTLDDLIHRIIDETAVCPYVGLLSATPQNNSPRDLKNQIYLFARDRKHSAFENVPSGGNLEAYFSSVEKQYADLKHAAEEIHAHPQQHGPDEMDMIRRELGKLSSDVRDKVLSDILVRRTRTDILKYYADDITTQSLHFPKIEGPNELKYILTDRLADLFAETMNLIAPEGEFHFRDAKYLCYFRYQAVRFLADEANKAKYKFKNIDAERFSEQLAKIMQMLLVKRLESSFDAFKESLLNLRRYTGNMLKMWDADAIFVCPDIDVNAIFAKNNYNMPASAAALRAKIAKLNAAGKNELGRNCEYRRADFKDEYINLLKNDLELVDRLYERWTSEVHTDPKLDEFRRQLPSLLVHPHNVERKLVIFTEAKATAATLTDVVEADGYRGRVLVVTAQNRKELEPTIRMNFDANCNPSEMRHDYDILITTEVLAEGVNLHRANFILNYDAPWNATRLMQRIGRVNRIGTKADHVYVYNFMPSADGDHYIKLVGKAYVKLQSFQSMFGEDSKIFTNQETVEHHDLNKIAAMDEESPYEKYISELKAFKAANPARYAEIESVESAETAVSTDDGAYFTVAPPNGIGLFVKVSSGADEGAVIPLKDVLESCKVEPTAAAVELPSDWEMLRETAITAFIHHHAATMDYLNQTKAAKTAVAYANKLKNDAGFASTLETKKLLAIAMKMAKGGNADVIKKLNKIGSQVYSPQMQLLPIVADNLNAAITDAFAAQVQNYESTKGKPRIVTGFCK